MEVTTASLTSISSGGRVLRAAGVARPLLQAPPPESITASKVQCTALQCWVQNPTSPWDNTVKETKGVSVEAGGLTPLPASSVTPGKFLSLSVSHFSLL